MIIKRIFISGVLAVAFLPFLTGCSKENLYDKEFYHPVVYLLSEGSQNVYTVVYPFKDVNAVRYFSVGCGGTLPSSEQVDVQLEPDTVLLKNFNRLNYVVDTPSFAKLLPSKRYQIASYNISLPANAQEQYVKVPVMVDQKGLSPDSIYFIPLSIKSVSRYEVNPQKRNVLFRVAVENDFAKQIVTTIYYQRGTMITGTNNISINGSKMVQPLSVDEVRMYAGTIVQTNKSTLAEIKSNSIVVKINSDQTTTVGSYNPSLIEIEQLTAANYNKYSVVRNELGKDIQYIDIYYRYRTRTLVTGVFGPWIEIKESLQRTN